MTKLPLGSADKVINVKVKERVRREVKAFMDRLGLEWFLEERGHRLNFKIKEHSIGRCAMWLCEEKELVEKDSERGEAHLYLKIKNPEEFERYKKMVRREVLGYVKKALER